MHREELALSTKTLGPVSESMLISADNLGDTLRCQEKYDEAREVFWKLSEGASSC